MNNQKLFLLTLLLLVTFLTGSGLADPGTGKKLEKLVQDFQHTKAMAQGHWSWCVIEVKSGNILFQENAQEGLIPASCLKLVTSAVALNLLGENFQCETRLGYTGKINPQGVLEGDLVIVGGGDPTLGSSRIESIMDLNTLLNFWRDNLLRLGIRQINGHIIGDDRFFDNQSIPRTWTWEDMGNYFGAGTSGLCINENLYELYFVPGRKAGSKAFVKKTDPPITGLNFINEMQTGPADSGDNGYIFSAPNQWDCWLRGTIPAGRLEFVIKGSMPNPAKVCARLLYDRLRKSNIEIKGQVYTGEEFFQEKNPGLAITSISILKSPQLTDIVYWLNKNSINLYAEQLVKLIGKHQQNEGSFEAGLKIIADFLAKMEIPVEGLFLHDGSGLSRLNSLSTLQLTKLLEKMTRTSCFVAYYNSLPVAGNSRDKGTVRHWCCNTVAANNARIKTGSLERIHCHAGYVHDRLGRLLCFAMFANNFNGKPNSVDRFHEHLVVQLAQLKD